MHPDQTLQVVRHRARSLEQVAADHRQLRGSERALSRQLRRRAGWWLVGLGLRLATGRPSAVLRPAPYAS